MSILKEMVKERKKNNNIFKCDRWQFIWWLGMVMRQVFSSTRPVQALMGWIRNLNKRV